MYTVITGAAGFIGSNLVKALNARGETRILAVDDLTEGDKFRNLVDCEIADYLDKDEFLGRLSDGDFDDEIAAVLQSMSQQRKITAAKPNGLVTLASFVFERPSDAQSVIDAAIVFQKLMRGAIDQIDARLQQTDRRAAA